MEEIFHYCQKLPKRLKQTVEFVFQNVAYRVTVYKNWGFKLRESGGVKIRVKRSE